MRAWRCLLFLGALTTLLGCSLPEDWGDDHLVLDELQLLEQNELWVELFSFPAQPAGCNLVVCQNVLSGASYEVIGDVDDAKVAALDELMQTWILTSDADPFEAPASDFQLRGDVDIDTSTGTAFATVRFMETFDLLKDEPVANAIVFTVTSDLDPNWMQDRVYTRDNFFSPGGLVLMFGSLCVVVPVFVLARKSRDRTGNLRPPTNQAARPPMP